MDFKIIEKKDQIMVEGLEDFELPHIFECGQCFRWDRQADGSFTGVAKNRVINVKKEGDQVVFDNTNLEDFHRIWIDYFDLNRDYQEIKDTLMKDDEVMVHAIRMGAGIRLLNQDEWETLVSFIVSSNRGIPIIKKSIEDLCTCYGEPLQTYNGKVYYDFPKPEVLMEKTIDEIQRCRTGYRSKYIATAATIVGEKQMDIYTLKNLDTEDARKQLLRFHGIGPKVADCILLFSMGKYDAFPVDVWVKRIVEYFYLPEGTPLKRIESFAKNKYGPYAGFAQQYLFYYARELGVGK